MMPRWKELYPGGAEWVGLLRFWLDVNDLRPVTEQLGDNYIGGWVPFQAKDKLRFLGAGVIQYPGDPPMHPAALTMIRDEAVVVYPDSWVLVVRRDGTFDMMRMD